MKTFLVFEPADGGRDADDADRILFVREKFYWPAFFFAPLWLLWHRLWIGFACWLVAETVLAVVMFMLDLNPGAAAIVGLLPSLVVAFEGVELRRRKLLRARYRETAVVVGRNREDAERRFFAEWAGAPVHREARAGSRAPAPTLMTPMPAPANPVIGLFPEPGAGR